MTAPTQSTAAEPANDTLTHWQSLVATQDAVGDCHRPGCDGQLRALPPITVGGLTWLEAECDHCHTGVGLPDGRRADTPRTLRPIQAVTDEGGDWRERQAKDLQ